MKVCTKVLTEPYLLKDGTWAVDIEFESDDGLYEGTMQFNHLDGAKRLKEFCIIE